MQTTDLAIQRRSGDGLETIEVQGELDLTNAAGLEEALQTTASAVVLDLGGLAFIDSAGIRTIDLAHRRLADEGKQLLVVAPPDSRAAWTFRVAGLADGYVFESVGLAAAVLDGKP